VDEDGLCGPWANISLPSQAGHYHNDPKDANIVVRADSNGGAERFYLVDLEGIHFA
jgi:hypothetical protein